MKIELTIENPDTGKTYYPSVEDGVKWTTDRTGAAGQLEFSVVKDSVINFREGNRVKLKVDGQGIFSGFVFKKKRNKDGLISVTAYDQLRYLKNKNTRVYSNKRASELLREIAEDFGLNVGEIEDTGYVIANRCMENTSELDTIQDALDLTLSCTGRMYVFYDDFGSLCLKDISSMISRMVISAQTAEDFEYETSIDSDVYNKIRLCFMNNEKNENEFYDLSDDESISRWGVLQYFEKIDDPLMAPAAAKSLLELYSGKKRSLSVSGVIGDLSVRAGSQVPVVLDLGDIVTNGYLIVEKCSHSFGAGKHTMDLELMGGEFEFGV